MEFTKEKLEAGQKLVESLVEKSFESETFKERLINNPQAAIESVVGESMTIPHGRKIVVEDQSNPNVIYLNIPPRIDIDELELSEEQLESVSGGAVWMAVVGVIVAGAQALDWIGQGYNSVH